MDSGYEVVLVDVNLATTNGINGTNGTHEEVAEMKTRSKVAGGDAAEDGSAKPKVRLTRTMAAQNDKDGSDSEKKEKKKSQRSGGGDADEAAGAKPISKEASAKQTAGAMSKVPAPTPAKKKALERDNDSGINSRASSVSNDDVTTPARMRTRASRASEMASTSTPARSGAARVPLSIYEYDAASFDDDLPLAATFNSKGASSAQKRKAVVYIEEMDDDEAPQEGGADSAEPAPKRSAAFLIAAGTGVVTSLLYPLRKLRSGISAIRPFKGSSATEAASAEQDEQPEGADGAVTPTADESMDASAQTSSETAAQSSDQPSSDEAANTCSLM